VNDRQSIDRVRRYLIPQPRKIEPADGAFAWPASLLLEPWGDLDDRQAARVEEFAADPQREFP